MAIDYALLACSRNCFFDSAGQERDLLGYCEFFTYLPALREGKNDYDRPTIPAPCTRPRDRMG
jgi:hypothetical protein